MEIAAPPVLPAQISGIAPVPSISQVLKTAAPGSASAMPRKKYGSMQEARQELQAIVAAMQALLADTEEAAAQLGNGHPRPYGDPPGPYGDPSGPYNQPSR